MGRALVGRALMGPALMGQALMGRALMDRALTGQALGASLGNCFICFPRPLVHNNYHTLVHLHLCARMLLNSMKRSAQTASHSVT